MRFPATGFIQRWAFSLIFLAALSACLPFNRPTPLVPSAEPATHPAHTSTPIPALLAAAPSPSTAPSPTASCLSRPGQLLDGVLDTNLLAKPMTYHVYLPPCYTEEQERRYPVLYLLHGQTYTEDQWIRLGVPSTADRLVASGEIPPFIIVFPYDYSYLQPWQYHFEDAFMQVLIPRIDTSYRTMPGAAQRAIGGLSRGGAWALHLGFHHLDVFGAIGAHSPAIFYSDGMSLPVYLRDIASDQLPRLYMDMGDADKELKTIQDFKSSLEAQNIPYEWHEYVGAHDETYWRAHVEEYLRWYGRGWQSNP